MTAKPLRVLQLNVGSLLEAGWDERRHEVVSWVDHLEPDVVCFQEVWENATEQNTAAWIADQSTIDWFFAFGGDRFSEEVTPDRSLVFGSAILSRWPIDHRHHERLPVGDNAGFFARAFPFELLHVRTADLDVVSTHLAPAPTDGLHRQRQVLAIDAYVRAMRAERKAEVGDDFDTTSMPPILCGDFNAEPTSDEIRHLCGLTSLDGETTTFWQDCWTVAGDGSPGLTQDWQTHPLAAALNVHRKRIDYVFVGDSFRKTGDAGRVLGAEIVLDTPRTGVLASDHCGLLATIQWPTRPD